MNTGLRVIGHGCESTTECTGDSKVRKWGGGSISLTGLLTKHIQVLVKTSHRFVSSNSHGLAGQVLTRSD